MEFMKMGDGNKPEKKFSTGAISATVWKNARNIKGKDVEYCSVTLQRRYKDNNGDWQSSSSLGVNDLPKAVLVLEKAFEYLVLKEGEQDGDVEG
ncbi:MAG: hypothetical protein KJ593_07535 [Candidatus Omnitrophica bacterium]|nr:hypothetical protein [Candidatus Omnitrophota bacterium]